MLLPFLLLILAVSLPGCSSSVDSPASSSRLRVFVCGPITEDAVWESGKEYYVIGDVTVEVGATLTIQPDVVGKFAHERTDEYSGVTVEGTLMADGGDSTTAIVFTSGAAEWARVKLQVKV